MPRHHAVVTLVTLSSLGVLALIGCTSSSPGSQPTPGPTTAASTSPTASPSASPSASALTFDVGNTGTASSASLTAASTLSFEVAFISASSSTTIRAIDSPVVPMSGTTPASTLSVALYNSDAMSGMSMQDALGMAYPTTVAATSSASRVAGQSGNAYLLDTPFTQLATGTIYNLVVSIPSGGYTVYYLQNNYAGTSGQLVSGTQWGAVSGIPSNASLYFRTFH